MIKEDDLHAPSALTSVAGVRPDALARMLGPVRVAAPPPPPSVHWPELSGRVRIQGVVRLHALISRKAPSKTYRSSAATRCLSLPP